MRIYILAICFMLSISANAENYQPLTDAQLLAINRDLHEANLSEGLIPPDSGMQMIVASEITSSVQQKIYEKYRNDFQEMLDKGYVEQNSEDAQSLLAMRYKQNLSKKELVPQLSDIKLAFPFSGLSFIHEKDIIGYAGYIAWDNGWLGVSEFFNNASMGVCNYKRHNIMLSHGGMRLISENISYKINGKPTDYIVRGKNSTGFLYEVNWYDPTYIHGLQCASETFNPRTIDNMFNMARDIDHVP